MKWNVGTKISAGFGITLLIFVIVGFVSWRNVQRTVEDSRWVAHTHEVIATLARVYAGVQQAETSSRGYVITGDESHLVTHSSGIAQATDQHRMLSKLVEDNPRQSARADNLGALIGEKAGHMQNAIDTRRKQDFAAAQQVIAAGTGKRTMDQIRELVETMRHEEESLLTERAAMAADASNAAQLTVLLGTLFAIILSSLLGILITRNVAGPMRQLTGAAERITVGDLSTTIDVGDRPDEVGVLARAFQKMTTSLRTVSGVAEQIAAGDLKVTFTPQGPEDVVGHALVKMIENLRRQISGLVEGATVLGSAASEIVASTAQLASGASESAAAVSQTTTTVEEIRQTAQLASLKARAVSETAQKTLQISASGRKSTEESLAGMARIRTQMESIGESMMRLSEQTQAVGQIIASVEDLAAQSNLLAVNAAIEAAKAGEQGKGFGVVAQEVKSLAEQSRAATDRVRSLLTDIQKATTAAVMATEQGSKAVEIGHRQTEAAGESIAALAGSVTEAAQAATQIAATSQQQLVGMDQVAGAMESIKQASTQNVASARQLEVSARDLGALGLKLKSLVDNYTV
ncbi:MAG TPA: CHASE3 domain-containing protein [Steroidobacteraceae bacterium]|nr:CHASE3 domain-containing protein [Steroidobacteraceae bacterium]